jgi:outer membrane protein assembly factor BamB
MSTQLDLDQRGDKDGETGIGGRPEAIKQELQLALRQGLAIVEKAWSYRTNDWATSLHVADLDGDGDSEVIVGTYDGRVQVLTKWGTWKWEQPLGSGKWICTVVGVPRVEEGNLVAPREENRVCVLAGSRDGCVYALNQRGYEVWVWTDDVGRPVRQVYVNPMRPNEVIIASESGYIHALDRQSKTLLWRYPTNGAVRCLFSSDIDDDGEIELLVATDDYHIHVLDSQGKCKGDLFTDYKVYTLFVARLDGQVTLLASTGNKSLHAWHIEKQESGQPLAFQKNWSLSPANSFLNSHIRAMYVADINSDSQPEILIVTEDKYFSILDQYGKPLWKYFLGERASSIYAADIDLDGIIEVLVGMEDNQVQALRVGLDKGSTPFTDLLDLYEQTKQAHVNVSDFSIAERQLLQDLVGKESLPVPDEHKEWAVVELSMQRHEYEQTLPLLLRLRRQRVQHFWSQPITGNGHICTITSGDITSDDVYGLLYGTEEGCIRAIDIAASKGKQLWVREFGGPISKIETQTLTADEPDILLGVTDGQRIYVLDSKGNLQRELVFEDEHDVASTLYIHKDGDRQRDVMREVIIGLANKKIYIYDGALQQRLATISTKQGNSLLCTQDLNNSGCEQIITAAPNNHIYVYTREGKLLWYYNGIDDQVRALCARDIDGDGYAEVIVGSEDRNLYVLDHEGHLKWRYRTPHRVLAVAADDVDDDGAVEVLVGVEDSYMYVLSGVGDLLWKYKASDRITAIHVQDMHTNEKRGAKSIEIALGAEDELQLLQVLKIEEVIERINICWRKSLDTENRRASILRFVEHENEDVRTLALAKLAGQIDQNLTEDELKLILDALENNSPEMRLEGDSLEAKKELARMAAVLDRDHRDDPKSLQIVRRLLQQLSTDRSQEVKLAVLQWLPWFRTMSICFEYLDRFSRNVDFWVRRTVVRQLDRLALEYPQQVFPRLLNFCKDEDKWIRQETGRSLAHYFDVHQEELFLRMPELFADGIDPLIIQQMAYSSASDKALFTVMSKMPFLNKQTETEVADLLSEMVRVLQEMSTNDLPNSESTLQKYKELRHLFQVKIIDDIEQYQWIGDLNRINDVAQQTQIPEVFPDLARVIDTVKRYRRRQSVGDRLAGLIQANNILARLKNKVHDLDDERVHKDLGASQRAHAKCPPEDHILELILDRWTDIIFGEIQRVRGEARLNVELKGKYTYQEEPIVVSLQISNTGRSPAENVRVRLEKSPGFEIVGFHEVLLDEIATHGPILVDFNIRPAAQSLRLVFDISYDDAERTGKKLKFAESVELRASSQPFKKIPNPYRSGLPLRGNEEDREMFFGRQEDLQFLQDKLTNPDANNTVVLSGQRRSGKTSLLYRFMGEIANLEQDIAVLIDLQSLASATGVQQFLPEFAREISDTLKDRGLDVPNLATFDFSENPTATFSLFLDSVLPAVAKRKLILLVDEFEILDDKIKKGEISPDFLKYLRSLMQHQQGITFLFAGAPKIRQMTEWYWAAFFNTTFPYTLSKLNTKDAEDLIIQPVSGYLEYDELAIEKLHRLTGDQPYLIHIICETLIRLANKKKKSYVTVNDVNIAMAQVIEREDHFVWIWNQEQHSATKHFILSILAQEKGEEGRIFSLADIKDGFEAQGRHFDRGKVTKALNELVEEGFVEEESDGTQFRIPVGLTRAWLRKVKPPERVAREEPDDEM